MEKCGGNFDTLRWRTNDDAGGGEKVARLAWRERDLGVHGLLHHLHIARQQRARCRRVVQGNAAAVDRAALEVEIIVVHLEAEGFRAAQRNSGGAVNRQQRLQARCPGGKASIALHFCVISKSQDASLRLAEVVRAGVQDEVVEARRVVDPNISSDERARFVAILASLVVEVEHEACVGCSPIARNRVRRDVEILAESRLAVVVYPVVRDWRFVVDFALPSFARGASVGFRWRIRVRLRAPPFAHWCILAVSRVRHGPAHKSVRRLGPFHPRAARVTELLAVRVPVSVAVTFAELFRPLEFVDYESDSKLVE